MGYASDVAFFNSSGIMRNKLACQGRHVNGKGCQSSWHYTTAEGVSTAERVSDCCRYLLRGVVMRYLNSRFPKWAAVDAALSNEGWKLVTLLRLSPVVPWNVLNYALSVTGLSSTLRALC